MEGFCRGCLKKYSDPTDLIQYCEGNRRMFVYSTGIQVKRNDSFTFQLCKECFVNMKQSCKFKKLCRSVDRKFKDYLSLKEYEGSTDFSTYLKNTENTLTLKLPIASANNTPAHQKNRDDDNDSTCTSIRNFMTDILQDEEMPPTEAQIIREVIQEEADILDDSLDSHWIQDDMSIVSEFDDFNFSTFSTPAHSINNYTPRKLEEKERDLCYTPNNIITSSPNKTNLRTRIQLNDMPTLDDFCKTPSQDFPNYFEPVDKDTLEKNGSILINKPEVAKNKLLDTESDYKPLSIEPPFENNTNLYLPNEDADSFTDNIDISIPDLNGRIEDKGNKSNKELGIRVNDFASEGFEKSIFQSPLTQELEHYISKSQDGTYNKQTTRNYTCNTNKELEHYINKAELKQKSKQEKFKRNDCTIDRNLEIALQNESKTEISLDQLIMTPQASSGASTPTIRNILFGTPRKHISSTPTNDEEHSNLDIEQFLKNKPVIQSKGKDIALMEQLVKDEIEDSAIEEQEETDLKPMETNNQDWYTNVSKLLDMGNNKTDLNFSISSDFLKDDKSEIEPFKRPISPDKYYDLNNFTCHICPKTYDSLKALKVHFAKFHNIKITTPAATTKKKAYKKMCDICGKEFNSPSNLYKHMKIHVPPERKYKCEICSQSFPTASGLRKHMYWHKPKGDRLDMRERTKEKVYYCNICGKEHRGLSNFKVHMARHNNEFITKCHLCDRGFYRNCDLKVHLRTHTQEKPFHCEECPKQFNKRHQLKNHMKRHIDNFKCDTCKIVFLKKYLIRRHLQTGVCPQNIGPRPIKRRQKRIAIQKPPENIDEELSIKILSNESVNNDKERLRMPSKAGKDSQKSVVNDKDKGELC